MNNIVTIKSVGGVIVGIAVGQFILKSKNILFLTAMGLAGGIIAYNLSKQKGSSSTRKSTKSASPNKTDTFTFIKKVEDSISDELDVNNEDLEESNEPMEYFYGENKEMQFDESLGYKSPYSTQLEFEKPSDFMDIHFNE